MDEKAEKRIEEAIEKDDYSGLETLEEIYRCVNEKGRLPWDHLPPQKWAVRWREVDEDLGIRRMVYIQGIDEKAYLAIRDDMKKEFKQREGESEWRWDMRLRLMYNRWEYRWKPGQSGNPGGYPASLKRAKRLSYTMKEALDAKLNEEMALVVEGRDGVKRKVMLTKKEFLARNLIDMAVTGQVTFPDPKGKMKKTGDVIQRTIEISDSKYADFLLKAVRLINPKEEPETEKIVQTVSFDIATMMPKEAKMTVVKKLTGKSFEEEEQYLGDGEVVDGVLSSASEAGEDVVLDEEFQGFEVGEADLEYEDLAEAEEYWEGHDE